MDMEHGAVWFFGMVNHVPTVRDMLGTLYTWRREKAAILHDGPSSTEDLGDVLAEAAHDATYAQVAISQAAIAAIAPLFEMLFHNAAKKLREAWGNRSMPTTARQLSSAYFWNPLYVYDAPRRSKQKNIREGFKQLLAAVRLQHVLTEQGSAVIEAVFSYRNNCLHEGYEWSQSTLQKFFDRAQEKGWAHWFDQCTVDEKPWLFLVSNQLVEHALFALNQLACSLRREVRILERDEA